METFSKTKPLTTVSSSSRMSAKRFLNSQLLLNIYTVTFTIHV